MPGTGAGYDSLPRYKAHSPIVIHIPGYARLRHISMRACHLMHFQTQTAFRVLENALVISGIFHEKQAISCCFL
ncbi:predicted protein [Brucella sp. 83/13]|uniref:hypothetical protein n=1 Tax=Brucella sp. NF 2653 TaxID=693748 RepID=UPI0001BD80B9|nr:predicted protein [Brucella sp. 83/13]